MFYLPLLVLATMAFGWNDAPLGDQAQAIFALNSSSLTDFTFPQPPRVISVRVSNTTLIGFNLSSPALPEKHDTTLDPAGRPLHIGNITGANFSFNPFGGTGQCDPGIGCCPDPRWNFRDTTYPWRAIGRVLTNRGTCTGALVGPRHLLTASHCVDWTRDSQGRIGWLEFQPDFFDVEVFGNVFAQHTYWASGTQMGDPTSEEGVGSDYVVAVLAQRIGDTLGWLGSRTYSTAWNGGNFWSHVGYPGDVGGGLRPSFVGRFPIANAWKPGFFGTENGLDIEFFACASPGDSGGPIFGWWNDGPHIVGVVSGTGRLPPVLSDLSFRTGNWAAGGSEMVNLIIRAQRDFP